MRREGRNTELGYHYCPASARSQLGFGSARQFNLRTYRLPIGQKWPLFDCLAQLHSHSRTHCAKNDRIAAQPAKRHHPKQNRSV